MILNSVERLMMNNPVRAALQRHFEAPRLLRMGGPATGAYALEVGCGRGLGVELIIELFGAARVDAIDLDPAMVERARARLAGYGERVSLATGDVTAITAADATYDVVFDFGIIHHVPDWADALAEIYRVLKPGGRFYAEEALTGFIDSPLWRRLLDHPIDNRFDRLGFCHGLEAAGFEVFASRDLLGQFAWYVADKPPPD